MMEVWSVHVGWESEADGGVGGRWCKGRMESKVGSNP